MTLRRRLLRAGGADDAPQLPLLGAPLRKHAQAHVDRVEALLRGRPDVRPGSREHSKTKDS
jgi:hypothetical protein